MQDGRAIYGVNTGFGSLSKQRIDGDKLSEVQHNLIRSHAAGVGEPLEAEVVRATMLLLAASLSRGHSAVRPEVVDCLVNMLNAGVSPMVPARGSVGASGDLAPLAHVALSMIGEGYVLGPSGAEETASAFGPAGIEALKLEAKEGLALINGTHLMAAHGSLLVCELARVFDAALVACAMSIDAARATDSFLDERVHAIRNQRGQARVASRLSTMLSGSEIIPSHAENDPRVQDPYSWRCAAQVLGAALDWFDQVRVVIERELGAVTDNPLVFPEAVGGDDPLTVSAGNFHGMPLAIAFDVAAIGLAHVAGISERRTFALLSAVDPESHLRPHLSPMPGLHSGLMITQYTAAANCNEMIGLATPASVSNISTCAGMEDYNSFGPRAAMKARSAIDRCAEVIAIELLCGTEALEYHRPLRSGHVVERAHEIIRSIVPKLDADRPPSPDISAVKDLILCGRFGD